jgi:phosphatidylinositol alpha-mannosyltransferase
MRIAQVCPYSLSVPGGVQEQVLSLARALRALGHDTTVLAPCDGPPPEPGVVPLGRSVPLATNGSVAPVAPDPACAIRTLATFRAHDFDVIHLQEPFAPGPTLTALVTRQPRLVGTFHRAGASSAYAAFRPIVRRLASRLDVRCAVSDDARKTAQEAVGGEYEMVFNGIDIDLYANGEAWPKEAPTIFFVGRHEQRKGLDVLIDAMNDIGPGVKLWVASDGPQTAELRSKTFDDQRIEWLGRISTEEKAARLRAADVFCAPSLHGESFGVVLLEAMAAGAPIVASDLPGYRNVARPDEQAALVAPGDAGALARALNALLGDDARREALRRAGRERAAEFSMDALARRYVGIYERFVDSSTRS